jgi:alkylresorcinol/alkylpyrone synthase
MPAYAEPALEATLVELRAGSPALGEVRVFLVDDGSEPPISARDLPPPTATFSIVLARHVVNLGQGAALETARHDTSVANLVASGLFGDGAAAVVMVGQRVGQAVLPRVVATRSRLYPETERAMGWDVGASGLRIVLGVEVPDLVRANVRGDVDAFLADHGLTRADIGWWVAHPGGPKVLEAMEEALEVGREALGVTWRSLDSIGNLSSASVLHVLADTLRDHPPAPGSFGVLMAMGPGFCLELVLLQAGVDSA